jgi:hypothetical protein
MQLPDGVQIMSLDSIDKVKDLWDKLNEINGLFDDYHKDRGDVFMNMLQAPNTVFLERTDGNGILYLTEVIPNLSATGHIVYWDKRLRGREEFTLNVLRWLMQVIPLVKMNVFLPDYAKAARAFTERLGFKREGKLRQWSYQNGKLFDMFVFGMTIEEALNGKLDATTSTDVSSTTHRSASGVSEQQDGTTSSTVDRSRDSKSELGDTTDTGSGHSAEPASIVQNE